MKSRWHARCSGRTRPSFLPLGMQPTPPSSTLSQIFRWQRPPMCIARARKKSVGRKTSIPPRDRSGNTPSTGSGGATKPSPAHQKPPAPRTTASSQTTNSRRCRTNGPRPRRTAFAPRAGQQQPPRGQIKIHPPPLDFEPTSIGADAIKRTHGARASKNPAGKAPFSPFRPQSKVRQIHRGSPAPRATKLRHPRGVLGNALSLSVLSRGYALAQKDKALVTSSSQLRQGDSLTVQLVRRFGCNHR